MRLDSPKSKNTTWKNGKRRGNLFPNSGITWAYNNNDADRAYDERMKNKFLTRRICLKGMSFL